MAKKGLERSKKSEASPESRHPSLKRIEFLVLLVLAEGESHGYRIVQEISRLTEGRVSVLPGNLYAILRRLRKQSFLADAPEKPAADLADQRRRYYRITGAGRQVLEAEAQLMRSLARAASETGLLPGGASS